MQESEMVDFESIIYDQDTLISEFTNRPVTDMDPKKYVFWCGICEMKLNTPHWAIVHLGGRVHREKLIELNPRLKRGTIWKNGMQLGCKRYYAEKSPDNNREAANGKFHEDDDVRFRHDRNDTANRRFIGYSNHSDDKKYNGNSTNHFRNGTWDTESRKPNSIRRSNSKDRFSDTPERRNGNLYDGGRPDLNHRSSSKDRFSDTSERRNGNLYNGGRPDLNNRSSSKDRFSDTSERRNGNLYNGGRPDLNNRSSSKDRFSDTSERRNGNLYNGGRPDVNNRSSSKDRFSGKSEIRNGNYDTHSKRPNLKRRSNSKDRFSNTIDISDENSKKLKSNDGVDPNLICVVCDRTYTTALQAIQHFRGKRHAFNVTAKIEAKKNRRLRNSSPVENSASPNEFRNRFEENRNGDNSNERNDMRYKQMNNGYEKRNVQNRVNDPRDDKVSERDGRKSGNLSFNEQRDERPKNRSDHWNGDRNRNRLESSSHKRNQEEKSLNTINNRVKRDYPYNRTSRDDRINNEEKTKQGWQSEQVNRLRSSNSSYRTRVQDSNLSEEVAVFNSYQHQPSLPSKISKNDRNSYIYGQGTSTQSSTSNNTLTKSKYEQTMNQLSGLQNGLFGLLNGNSFPLSLPALNLSTVYPTLNIPVNNAQYEKHR